MTVISSPISLNGEGDVLSAVEIGVASFLSPDRKIGLLYEEKAAMGKNAKRSDGRKVGEQEQLWLRLPGLVREASYDTVISTGLDCVNEVLEAERARGFAACPTSIRRSARRCGRGRWRALWFWVAGE